MLVREASTLGDREGGGAGGSSFAVNRRGNSATKSWGIPAGCID